MARDPRYDILFEPVRIGPVTAKNRFYQVPHCNGMGYRDPSAMARMRGIKAEGGWAVVCTEQCEIHPSSEIARAMRGIVKASRRPPRRPLPVRPRDRNGGFPKSCGWGLSASGADGAMLVDGARGSRCPASPRYALLAESPNLEAWGKPSL